MAFIVYRSLSPSGDCVVLCAHTCQVVGLVNSLKEGVKSLGDDNETVAMLNPKVLRELISPLSLGRRALFENPQGWGIRQICACSLALCRLTSCSGHLRSRGDSGGQRPGTWDLAAGCLRLTFADSLITHVPVTCRAPVVELAREIGFSLQIIRVTLSCVFC